MMECVACHSSSCSTYKMRNTPKNEIIRCYRCEKCHCTFETVESVVRLIDQKPSESTDKQLKEKDQRLQEIGLSAEEIHYLQRCEELNCIDWLREIQRQKGISGNSEEDHFLQQRLQETKLQQPVINVLIYYILLVRNRHYLHSGKTFFTTTRDWEQKKIMTAEKAFSQLKEHERKISTKGNRKIIRKEVMPDWSAEERKLTEEESLEFEIQTLKFMDIETDREEVIRWIRYKESAEIGTTLGEMVTAFQEWREKV